MSLVRPRFYVSAFDAFNVWVLLFPLAIFSFSLFMYSGLASAPVAWFGVILALQFLIEGLCFIFTFGMSFIALFAAAEFFCLFPLAISYSTDVVGPDTSGTMGFILVSVVLASMVIFMLLTSNVLKRNPRPYEAIAKLAETDNHIYDLGRFKPWVKKYCKQGIVYILILTAVFTVGSSLRDRTLFLHSMVFAIMSAVFTIFIFAMIIWYIRN